MQFNREVSYYAKRIVDDVSEGKKSPEQGLKEIKDEQDSLFTQSWEVAKKGVGVVAGAMQFVAGAGIFYGSVGTLCLVQVYPLWLMVQITFMKTGATFGRGVVTQKAQLERDTKRQRKQLVTKREKEIWPTGQPTLRCLYMASRSWV
ncbi:hypothetical protein A584_05607 [Pseudomonas syringae pv. theae ICMP 3923]|nr:hypothetical protein A584_05607 [Pseudomonas syringae pv. theae ICMP 3923]GKQ33418.1 hypothetical protein PSTH68_27885 [Pseudomonas syringae pv. theae]